MASSNQYRPSTNAQRSESCISSSIYSTSTYDPYRRDTSDAVIVNPVTSYNIDFQTVPTGVTSGRRELPQNFTLSHQRRGDVPKPIISRNENSPNIYVEPKIRSNYNFNAPPANNIAAYSNGLIDYINVTNVPSSGLSASASLKTQPSFSNFQGTSRSHNYQQNHVPMNFSTYSPYLSNLRELDYQSHQTDANFRTYNPVQAPRTSESINTCITDGCYGDSCCKNNCPQYLSSKVCTCDHYNVITTGNSIPIYSHSNIATTIPGDGINRMNQNSDSNRFNVNYAGHLQQHGQHLQWQEQQRNDLTSWQKNQNNTIKTSTIDLVHSPYNSASRITVPVNSPKNDPFTPHVRNPDEDMIERLRGRILYLEQQCNDYTNTLEQTVQGPGYSLHKMKELEQQNVMLKSKMSEMTSSSTSVVDDLEIKLGAAEHEIMNLKSQLHTSESAIQQTTSGLEDKLQAKEIELSLLQDQYKELKAEHKTVKETLDRTERYMGELKSVEETQRDNKVLGELRDETSNQKTQIEELLKKLQTAKKVLTERNQSLKQALDKISVLEKNIEDQKKELDRLRNVGDGALLRVAEINLMNIKAERDKMAQEVIRAKQLLDACKRTAHETAVNHSNQISTLKDELAREESSHEGLRKELDEKVTVTTKLKANLKQVIEEKQNLEETNHCLMAQVTKYESKYTEETLKLENQLIQEVTSCFNDLQALVNVCLQRAEGQEPNISSLLGMNSLSLTAEPTRDIESPRLKLKLDKIKTTRVELDRLRSLICTKFAEDLGDRLSCILQ